MYAVAVITKLSSEVEHLFHFLEFRQTLKKISNKLTQATTYATERGNSVAV